MSQLLPNSIYSQVSAVPPTPPQTPPAEPVAAAQPAPAASEAPAARPAQDNLEINEQGQAQPHVSLTEEPAEKPKPDYISHVVRPGDNLAKLAKKYMGDSKLYMDIFEINRNQMRNPNQLDVGMTLLIPASQDAINDVAGNDPETPQLTPDQLNELPTHKVRKGESLSTIALSQLGDASRYLEIYELNKDQLSSPDKLRLNMELRLPAPKAAPPPAETPEAPPADPNVLTHTVRTGESLGDLARRYLGNPNRFNEIFEANRDQLSNPNRVKVGMTLKIPGGDPNAKPPEEVTGPSTPSPVGPLTEGAQQLYDAMIRYQAHHNQLGNTNRTKTTPEEMHQIAYELDAASKAFGVDPKMMLALYAHESGGINPRAKSHTGAGGLGQLTGIAIRQVHFLAGMGGQRGKAPYTQYRGNLMQHTNRISERYNIKKNIWTSVAYMKYELTDRASLGRGVEKALKRYGDPNVSTYANKVNNEYRTLFGGRLF